MTHDNGGPAFPARIQGLNPDHEPVFFPGMSLFDYLMAHAPAEPQPWFEPVLPEFPKQPSCGPQSISPVNGFGRRRSPEGVADLRRYCDKYKNIGIDYVKKDWEAYWDLAHEWDAESDSQRYIQWPAAWATAMIKEKRRVEAEAK